MDEARIEMRKKEDVAECAEMRNGGLWGFSFAQKGNLFRAEIVISGTPPLPFLRIFLALWLILGVFK